MALSNFCDARMDTIARVNWIDDLYRRRCIDEMCHALSADITFCSRGIVNCKTLQRKEPPRIAIVSPLLYMYRYANKWK